MYKPFLILLQETITLREKPWETLLNICPEWFVCATNAMGHSNGWVAMWDPRVITFKAFLSCLGIILINHMMGTNLQFFIINSYAPYFGQRNYWDHIANHGFLDLNSFILVGNHNISMGMNEIWGDKVKKDHFSTYFNDMFNSLTLRDVTSDPIVPTWWNGRIG